MEIDLLKKMKHDFLNKKTELESNRNSLVIQVEEKKKYLEKLMEEDRYNFDAFSPRKQNNGLKENISDLESQKNKLESEIEDMNLQLNFWNDKIKEMDSLLESEIKTVRLHNSNLKLNHQEKSLLLDILHKIELCHQISFVDPKRCKMELSLIIEKLHQIVQESDGCD